MQVSVNWRAGLGLGGLELFHLSRRYPEFIWREMGREARSVFPESRGSLRRGICDSRYAVGLCRSRSLRMFPGEVALSTWAAGLAGSATAASRSARPFTHWL